MRDLSWIVTTMPVWWSHDEKAVMLLTAPLLSSSAHMG